MAEISKIEIGGVEYDIKDETARAGCGLSLIGTITERFVYEQDNYGNYTKVEIFGQDITAQTKDTARPCITINCPEEVRVLAREAKFIKIHLLQMDSATYVDWVKGMYPCALAKDTSLPVSFGIEGYREAGNDPWFDDTAIENGNVTLTVYLSNIKDILEYLHHGWMEYTLEFYA